MARTQRNKTCAANAQCVSSRSLHIKCNISFLSLEYGRGSILYMPYQDQIWQLRILQKRASKNPVEIDFRQSSDTSSWVGNSVRAWRTLRYITSDRGRAGLLKAEEFQLSLLLASTSGDLATGIWGWIAGSPASCHGTVCVSTPPCDTYRQIAKTNKANLAIFSAIQNCVRIRGLIRSHWFWDRLSWIRQPTWEWISEIESFAEF